MVNSLGFSFDDEIVNSFCYDMVDKVIQIHFNGYSDLITSNRFLAKECVLTIKNWTNAKGKVGDESKFKPIDDIIGVFSMVLSIDKLNENLEMYVNTLDNRYIFLIFEKPEINFHIK